jgi:small ligand-binding sensory domain FIST
MANTSSLDQLIERLVGGDPTAGALVLRDLVGLGDQD